MKVVARKMKRLLSLLLTVAMVVTMLPQSLGGAITVSAAETSDTVSIDEPNSVKEGEQGSVGWVASEDEKNKGADAVVNTDPDDDASADSGAGDSTGQGSEESGQTEGENPDDADGEKDPGAGESQGPADEEKDPNAGESQDPVDDEEGQDVEETQNPEEEGQETEEPQDPDEEEPSEVIDDVILSEKVDAVGISNEAEGGGFFSPRKCRLRG